MILQEVAHTNIKVSPGSPSNVSLDCGMGLESPNVSSTPLDRTFTSDGTTVKGILSMSSLVDEGKSRILQPLSSESQINSEQKVVSDPKTSLQSKGSGSFGLNPNKTSTNKDSSVSKDSSSNKVLKENNDTAIVHRLATRFLIVQDGKGQKIPLVLITAAHNNILIRK